MAELMDAGTGTSCAARSCARAEVQELAGEEGTHDPDRVAYRHGTTDGKVTLGGRRVPLTHPRVRPVDGKDEIPLQTYTASVDTDLMAE